MIKIRDEQPVVDMFNSGKRTVDIARHFGVTPRTIQRIVYTRRGLKANRRGGKSVENQLQSLRVYVVQLLREQGRDFSKCELCLVRIPRGKFDLHHRRYDGATMADIAIVCRACNVSYQNRYLD